MNAKIFFIVCASITLSICGAGGKLITLTVSGSSRDRISVGTNEALRVVSFPEANEAGNSRLQIFRNGLLIFQKLASSPGSFQDARVVAGPAEVELTGFGGGGFCTVEITPDIFPPDRTVVIPEGGGAVVALQSSTNLVAWTNVFSQTYSNVPANQFFRICIDRLPQ